MDEINYLNQGMRKAILDQIDGNENKEAKTLSVNQYEIFKDRILPFVESYLERFYSKRRSKRCRSLALLTLLLESVSKRQGSIWMLLSVDL